MPSSKLPHAIPPWIGAVVACAGSLAVMLAWSGPTAWAQAPSPAAPSPDGTAAALQAGLATQQAWSADLERELTAVATERALELAAVRQELGQANVELQQATLELDRRYLFIAVAAGVIVALLAFFGVRTYREINDLIRERVSVEVDRQVRDAILGLDPTQVTVRLPRERDMEAVQGRLALSGFAQFEWYDPRVLDGLLADGINLIHLRAGEEGVADQEAFRELIAKRLPDLDPYRVAFVLYSPAGFRIDEAVIGAYANVAVANMPTTAASAVLVVARGMRRPGAGAS